MKKESNAKENKRGSKRRRLLLASIAVAILIVAAATFAWFTSKDEVTNRLATDSSFGVTVVEKFKPVKNWVPGQEVNKDVTVLNTGTANAFVRAALNSRLTLTTYDTYKSAPGDSSPIVNGERVTLQKNDAAKTTYTYLSISSEEAKALQSGGYMLAAVVDESGSVSTNTYEWVPVDAGTLQSGEPDTSGDSSGSSGKALYPIGGGTTGNPLQSSMGGSTNAGLYIFRREVGTTTNYDGSVTTEYEYTGYYAIKENNGGSPETYSYYKIELVAAPTDADGNETGEAPFADVYQCAETETDQTQKKLSDSFVLDGKNYYIGYLVKNPVVYENTESDQTVLTTEYRKGTNDTDVDPDGKDNRDYLLVTYDPLKDTKPENDPERIAKKVTVRIYLNGEENDTTNYWSTYWTTKEMGDYSSYYYKSILGGGEATMPLVDAIELVDTVNNDVANGGYNAIVYDLTVVAESVQAIDSTETTEITQAVLAEWGTGANPPGPVQSVTITDAVGESLAGLAVEWTLN